VLVTIDTLRDDRVGVYGDTNGLTPNIDALARGATVFERAVSPIATTTPAHASLFTGVYPRRHGVRWNGGRLDDSFRTLAEQLSAAGYDTAAFIAMPSMIRQGNLGQGFATTSEAVPLPLEIRPGAEVNRLAIEWLSGDRSRPFFVWIHYFEVHSPYRLTRHAAENLADYDGPYASGASVDLFYAYGTHLAPATPENRRAINALYDGEVVETDLLVGEILETLDDRGLADDTVVIVTSDHGQLLGERDTVGHGFKVWEPAIRIPLVIRDPRAPGPSRIRDRVGLIDLFPTILEYARLDAPEGISARSLVPDVRGTPGEEASYLVEIRSAERGMPEKGTVAVLKGDRKLVVSSDGVQAYDLATDPAEEHPLPPDADDVFWRLKTVAEMHRAIEPGTPANETIDPEVIEHLRTLGYIR
jgi:arylsulfatase